MDKKVLLISQGATFMVDAISKNLVSAGYDVIHAAPKMEELSAHKNDALVYVFFLGDFLNDIPNVLIYLKDLCIEHDTLLILIGNPAELSSVEQTIPSALVAARFERPFDFKKLIDEVDRLEQANSDNARKKNILLVDDDGTFLKMVKGWLTPTYRVTIVSSGVQALMYIADNTPDLILLDYEMPVTSGPQVLEMIRSESKVGSIPVIFLTGKSDRESVMKVMEFKPDGYLLKSMDKNGLLKALDDFFEKKRYQDLHNRNVQ